MREVFTNECKKLSYIGRGEMQDYVASRPEAESDATQNVLQVAHLRALPLTAIDVDRGGVLLLIKPSSHAQTHTQTIHQF
jgi:hypothetical protein